MIPAPPGPFRPGFWRSPLRGPWLTAVLGSVLLVLVTIVAVTGFLSHAAYQPDLGSNALVRPDLPFTTFFGWPSGPSWLYALSQGLHVNVGLAVIPVVLAKLWSVIPRLFAWPPVRSASEGFERLTVALLVASTGFLLATGVANIQYWYVFRFDFVRAHYYAAVVFVAALVAHLVVKIPVALRAYRARGVIAPLRAGLADTRPEPDGDLVAAAPDPPTVSRRGLLLAVGGGSLTLAVANAGVLDRRPAAADRVPRPAPRRRLPGQQDRGGREGHAGDDRRVLPARRRRRGGAVAQPRGAARAAAGHAHAHARLRRGLVDAPDVDRRAARRARPPRGGAGAVRGPHRVAPAGRRAAPGHAGGPPGRRRPLAARAAGRGGGPGRPTTATRRGSSCPSLPGVHNTKWVGRLEFRA